MNFWFSYENELNTDYIQFPHNNIYKQQKN